MKVPVWICASLLLAKMAMANPGESSGEVVPANRDLNQFVTTEVGMITLSADGNGMMATSGFLQVEKPSAAATVRVAYLAAASTGFINYNIPNGDILLNGTPVSWTHTTPSGILSYNHMADVTAIVAPVMAAAAPGITAIPVTELHSISVDGTALYVIFDDPATTVTRTAVLAFGAQATTGDNFSIGFGQPVFPDANTVVEFGLGISYGYARGTCQTSYVDVNGARLTSSAGGNDEGENFNGALITVGGVGDSRSNPLNPMFNDPCSFTDYTTYDDELYNIAGYIGAGSTSMSVHTFNPSSDDNIFAATLLLDFAAVIGEGGVLTPAHTSGCVGDNHTVTLSLQDANGNPLVNAPVTIDVVSGPNAGLSASGTSNTFGQFSFTYQGLATGTDMLAGSFTNSSGVTQLSNLADMTWQACNGNESGVLTPDSLTTCIGNAHAVTLTLQDGNGSPLVNVPASILVISGPNVGLVVNGNSNANGQLFLSYTSSLPGTDHFRGSFTNSDGILELSNSAQVEWQACPAAETGVLTPDVALVCTTQPHTVTLTLQDSTGVPLVGFAAGISILSGPNAGLNVTGTTNAGGQLVMTWTSTLEGTDRLRGFFTNSNGILEYSNSAQAEWQACTATQVAELRPIFSANCLGDDQDLTLTMEDDEGNVLPDYDVTITITDGPNAGLTASGTTDELGEFTLNYSSAVLGIDTAVGSYTNSAGLPAVSNPVTAIWQYCITDVYGELGPDNVPACMHTPHTVSLSLFNGDDTPLAFYDARLEVISGPNTGVFITGMTDADGRMDLTWTSTSAGTDRVEGTFLDEFGETVGSNIVDVDWENCGPEAPSVTISNGGPCSIVLNWNRVQGALSYNVWTRPSLGQPWTLLGNTTTRSFNVGCITTTPMQLFRVTSVY